jgi:uncharacterized membrane protein
MPETKQRYLFIDLLRFVAAFFMIQGHVFDALLSAEVKSHPSFYLYDFFHGFVAPAFLFASGVTYGASTMTRWDEHAKWGKRAERRILRFLGLIAIGYALHLPYFSLRKIISSSSEAQIKSLLQSDVLQCIGVTLLLLQIGVLLLKRRKIFEWIVAAAAGLVIFASPLMWSGHFSGHFPTAVVSYLSPENGSWFPLFPWSGYILCGVVFGCVFVDIRNSSSTARVMLKYAVLSLAVLLLSWGVMYLPFELYPSHDFWKSNPTMFFVRLGAIGVVTSAIFLAERLWKKPPYFPSVMGRESLFIYILHLLIVYGSVVNRGLSLRIGPVLQVVPAFGVFALVFSAISLITLAWHAWKETHKTSASWVMAAAAATFFAAFVIRPW